MDTSISDSTEASSPAHMARDARASGRKALLTWVVKLVSKLHNTGVEIRDFGTSWRDGHALSTLIHSIDPHLIEISTLNERTNSENLERAFQIAEDELGIPRLLDPEDVDLEKPDERSIMTYVAQFLKEYPSGPIDRVARLKQVGCLLL
ncbi:unnamed protein product [Protopolystoma xenopodis]|uniref:Calponin-homology (CH) domain-containing protein n=1 Tax=Protopolystoma xenopodis TaxID=117903 RepID=A0A3S5C4G6_9PLAT|nr:unnamed protein product [Protopolystoma xenopodis]